MFSQTLYPITNSLFAYLLLLDSDWLQILVLIGYKVKKIIQNYFFVVYLENMCLSIQIIFLHEKHTIPTPVERK